MFRLFSVILSALSIFSLMSCAESGSSAFSGVSYNSPQIINVSSYDPKERQRKGSSYTKDDLKNLKKNGAHGLIARTSKGGKIDTKAADFLAAANREGMLLGGYHFITAGVSAKRQADIFINRVRSIAKAKGLQGKPIVLVADFHNKSSIASMVTFIKRVEHRTGKRPIIYMENADPVKINLRNAKGAEKALIKSCPYWMALYGHVDDMKSKFSANRPLTPRVLLDIYSTWDDFALWQYGGVEWSKGKSRAKVYSHGAFQAPPFFGNMDRPMERNVFNGSVSELNAFWKKWGVKF